MLTCISMRNLIKDIPRGSRAMKFHSLTTDERTHKVIMHTWGSWNFFFTVAVLSQMFKSISLVSTVWLPSEFYGISHMSFEAVIFTDVMKICHILLLLKTRFTRRFWRDFFFNKINVQHFKHQLHFINVGVLGERALIGACFSYDARKE